MKMLAPFVCTLIFCSVMVSSHGQQTVIDTDNLMDVLVGNGFARQSWTEDEPLLKLRTIIISGKIHEEVTRDVVGKLLYLDHLAPGEPIDIYVRSTGGWLDDSFSIIDVMSRIKSPVNIHAMGVCQSAGVVLLLGATGEKTAGVHSVISPHFNQYLGEDYSKRSSNYKRFEKIYKNETKIPFEWYKSEKEKDKYYHLSAKQALDFEVIDRIRESK